MHIYYSDTSALVKLYLPEIGTGWVTAEYQRPDVLVVIGDKLSVVSSGSVAFTFVSADDALNRGAAAEALMVENPNLHP